MFFKKTLSVFLSFLLVFYAAVFSGGQFIQTTFATEVTTDLLFPLENPAGDTGDGVSIAGQCNFGFIWNSSTLSCEDANGDTVNGVCPTNLYYTETGCVDANAFCASYDAVWNGSYDKNYPKCDYVAGSNCLGDEQWNGEKCTPSAWLKKDNMMSEMLGLDTGATNTDLVAGASAGLVTAAYGTTTGSGLLGEAIEGYAIDAASYIQDGIQGGFDSVTQTIGIDKINVDGVGAAATAGIAAAAVTLLMGGSIEDAAIAGVKAAAIQYVSSAIATSLFATGGALSALPALIGIPVVGWAIAIGLIISMLVCPVAYIDLPNGEAGGFTTFLVGKINKQMEGKSFERFNLTDKQLSLLNSQQTPRLNVVVGEIVPEILYLNSLKALDLQSAKAVKGNWFFNQFEEAEFFAENEGESWINKKEETLPAIVIPGYDPVSSKKTAGGSQNGIVNNWIPDQVRDDKAAGMTTQVADFSSDENIFNIQIHTNKELKILVEGGITSVYHKEKFRLLAKFKPVLYWFYILTDNTKLGEFVEREIYAKEGFTLQEKINGEWNTLHNWVTYPDQGRAIRLEASNNTERELRITYKSEYLDIDNVTVSTEANPDFTLTELTAENLPETLEASDDKYEVIETGTYNTYFFNLPKIDEEKVQRTLFLQSEGYYHPMDSYEHLQEVKEQDTWWKEKISFIKD